MRNIEQITGENIKKRRKALKMTQPDLAKATGLTIQTIGRLEKGIKRGRKANLEAIAKALDCSREDLESYPAPQTPSVKSLIDALNTLEKQAPSELIDLWNQLPPEQQKFYLKEFKEKIIRLSKRKNVVAG